MSDGVAITSGAEIAGYRVEELVGRGGMGEVYRAHHSRLERNVALKILAPRYADDEWIADLDAQVISRVDLRTHRVIRRLCVGGNPVRLARGFGSMWAQDDRGRVLRIKPER
jgi:serine/threonine protein kinase